ncbi:MAG: holo-ACP synthase [Verrucomicrobiota bacterium]|nr:holo-ACP synthase [Verrucomicrobiota bacterium]
MKGLGSDLVEVARIRSSIEQYGTHFLRRLFTEKEQEYCLKFKDPAPHFAGRFAAKEAAAKALGVGIGEHLGWLDMEIGNDSQGKPLIELSPKAKERFASVELLLSITHTKEYAFAVVMSTNL